HDSGLSLTDTGVHRKAVISVNKRFGIDAVISDEICQRLRGVQRAALAGQGIKQGIVHLIQLTHGFQGIKRNGMRSPAISKHRRQADVVDVVGRALDRKSTRLNSSHVKISYAVFCLKKKKTSYIAETAKVSLHM